jgi:threonine dehydrogenase-like Zn-dependent dehydrogenase
MLAGVFHGLNDLRVEEVPVPRIQMPNDGHEKHIIGNWVNPFCFPAAIAMMMKRALPSDILFTHEFKLKDLLEAMEVHKSGKSIKVMIWPK